jgi:hypothetical protein
LTSKFNVLKVLCGQFQFWSQKFGKDFLVKNELDYAADILVNNIAASVNKMFQNLQTVVVAVENQLLNS